MKSVDEFETYYYSRVAPEFSSIEKRRKRANISMKVFDYLIILAIISTVVYTIIREPFALLIMVPALAIGAPILRFVIHSYHVDKSEYYSEFKKSAIAGIASFLGEDFSYIEVGKIGQEEFSDSHIFSGRSGSLYTGRHLIEGQAGEMKIFMSEVYSGNERRTSDGVVSSKIFNGIFIIIMLPRSFKNNLVMTKNDFYKNYLSGRDEKFLDSGLFLDDVKFSFRRNKMYIAIPSVPYIFDAQTAQSLYDDFSVSYYYQYLKYAIEIGEHFIADETMWR